MHPAPYFYSITKVKQRKAGDWYGRFPHLVQKERQENN